jgi:hypothetical protein
VSMATIAFTLPAPPSERQTVTITIAARNIFTANTRTRGANLKAAAL